MNSAATVLHTNSDMYLTDLHTPSELNTPAFRMCWWSGNLEKKEKKKEKKREKEEKRKREGREGKDSNFKYLCPNLVSNRRRPSAIDDDAQPHHTILC